MTAKQLPQVQFLTSDNGERTAAVIPIDAWKAIEEVYKERIAILEGIQEGLTELKEIKAGRAKGVPIENLWDELED